MITLLQQICLTPEQQFANLLELTKTEYNALKNEQTARAALASIGAVVYAALSAAPWMAWALLALPVATSVSAWVYIANERLVSLIGEYIDSVGVGLAPACGGAHPFGWERYSARKADKHQRKVFAIQMQMIVFVGAGAVAAAVGLALAPEAWVWVARGLVTLDVVLLVQVAALVWRWR